MEEPELARLRVAAFRRCRQAGATREDADDCAQEALLATLRARTSASISVAWIRTVAYRRFVDLVRRRSRERSGGLPSSETDRTQEGPEDLVVGQLHARWLTSTLEELPLLTRQVCEAVGQGDDVGTLADRYGLTRRSIESHLTRARRALRQLSIKGLLPIMFLRTLRDTPTRLKTAVVSAASGGATTPALLIACTALSPLLLHDSAGPPSKPLPINAQEGNGLAHSVRGAMPTTVSGDNPKHRGDTTVESAPAPAHPSPVFGNIATVHPRGRERPKLSDLPVEDTRPDASKATKSLTEVVPAPSVSRPAIRDRPQVFTSPDLPRRHQRGTPPASTTAQPRSTSAPASASSSSAARPLEPDPTTSTVTGYRPEPH